MSEINVIGLDMDGVMIDLAEYQFLKGIPYFSKRMSVSDCEVVKDASAYDVEDIFGVTRLERMKFWKRYIWGYCLITKPTEGVSELTYKWHSEGRKVKIITSRVYVMEKNLLGALFRKMVFCWLSKNRIYYDKVIFCGEKNSAEDKLNACKCENVDLMVDDKVENVNAISAHNVTLCYDNPWNKSGLIDGIVKVKNFYEVDDYIKKYESIS